MSDGSSASLNIHGTAIAVSGRGVLLRGPSGIGKSDLALRLIEQGAALIADDRTLLHRNSDSVWVSAPETILGVIEVRGVGLVRMPFLKEAKLHAVIDLVSEAEVERLPPPDTEEIMGIAMPLYRLYGFAASAVTKIRLITGTLSQCEVMAV
jgi:HPr kinase/phosphorylase